MQNPEIQIASSMIRLAEFPQDIPAIQDIAEKAWYATFSEIETAEFIAHELKREYSEEGLTQQTNNQHQFILLLNQERPVGYASFQHLPDENKTKLHKLYLLPECKGKGLGAQLIDWVESRTKENGMAHVELLVNRDNKSVGFYLKQGYEITASLDTQVGENFWRNDYVMQKPLG